MGGELSKVSREVFHEGKRYLRRTSRSVYDQQIAARQEIEATMQRQNQQFQQQQEILNRHRMEIIEKGKEIPGIRTKLSKQMQERVKRHEFVPGQVSKKVEANVKVLSDHKMDV